MAASDTKFRPYLDFLLEEQIKLVLTCYPRIYKITGIASVKVNLSDKITRVS